MRKSQIILPIFPGRANRACAMHESLFLLFVRDVHSLPSPFHVPKKNLRDASIPRFLISHFSLAVTRLAQFANSRFSSIRGRRFMTFAITAARIGLKIAPGRIRGIAKSTTGRWGTGRVGIHICLSVSTPRGRGRGTFIGRSAHTAPRHSEGRGTCIGQEGGEPFSSGGQLVPTMLGEGALIDG